MSMDGKNADLFLAGLIASQDPAYSLAQPFYTDQGIYEREIEHLFLTDWLYICHASQIPAPGDCYSYDFARESVIVCRDEQGRLHAFANVCRHRGSRIAGPGCSHVKRLVCPYHAWTYGLDGRLIKARLMPDDFDKSKSSLKSLPLVEFNGFIFISFSDNPPSFTELERELATVVDVFEFNTAKVAFSETHVIEGNWKLVFENYNECYHCGPAHKEYAASHSLTLGPDRQAEFDAQIARRADRAGIPARRMGLSQGDPRAQNTAPYYYNRYALFDGYLTGSEDGRPVAPLLGRVKEYDGGASDLQLGNFTYLLIYADHAVLYRFMPRSVTTTDADLIWLVRGDAREGSDYDLERMKWLWHVTTLADKDIIERNQQGVLSRFYQPGPYAPMETYTVSFIKWYLARMSQAATVKQAAVS